MRLSIDVVLFNSAVAGGGASCSFIQLATLFFVFLFLFLEVLTSHAFSGPRLRGTPVLRLGRHSVGG